MFRFSAPLKCHWPIRASSLKNHSPAGRIYSPLATGRVLMKRLNQDILIQFEDLKSVDTPPPMGGCLDWWVDGVG